MSLDPSLARIAPLRFGRAVPVAVAVAVAVAVNLAVALGPAVLGPGASASPGGPGASERGQAVYRRHCATCHGDAGQGDGPTGRWLGIAPRNFTLGQFRFRSTPSGTPPSDDDLVRTVTWGVPGTEMAAWGEVLSAADIRAVVGTVKSFSPRFVDEDASHAVILPPVGSIDSMVLEKGRVAYGRMQCGACHGASGRGDGLSMAGLKDEEGRALPAADLTRRQYKGGWRPEDIMRSVMTGLDGAAMPSYTATLPDDEAAALVHYVLSLRRPGGLLGWLMEAPR